MIFKGNVFLGGAFIFLMFVVSAFPSFAQIVNPEYTYGTIVYRNAQFLFEEELLKLAEKELRTVENFANLPTEAQAVLLSAKVEFYDGRADYAQKILEKYLEDNKSSTFIPFFFEYLAYISFEQKDYEKSDNYFRKAIDFASSEFSIRKDSSYIEVISRCLYWDGLALLRLGKVDFAKEPLEKCFRLYTKSQFADESLYLLGLIYELKGQEENAIAYYKTLQKNYPRSNLILASIVRETNNYLTLRQDVQVLVSLDLAEAIYYRIQAKDSIGILYEPQDFIENFNERIDFMRGEAYNIGGKYDQAVASFESFIQKYPSSQYIADAKIGVVWALLNKGDFIKCIESSTKMLEEGEKITPLQKSIVELYIGICNRRMGRLAEAQKQFSELVINPNYPFLGQVLLELGMIYYERKEFETASRTFERGLRESNDNAISAKLHLMLAATYLEMKNWNKAISQYKNAEEIAKRASIIQIPNRNWIISESRLKQAIAQIHNYRNSEAIQNLLYFIGNYSNDPRAEEALFWLAESYYRSDMLRNAIDKYESLLSKYPTTKFREDVLYGLGWSYFRLKNFKKSGEIFAQLVQEFPNSKYGVEVWLRQGDGFFVLKNFKQAIESYQKVISLNPSGEESQYAQYQICHSLYKMNNLDAAYNQVLEFVKKYPNSIYAPNALYLNGWIRFQQKNYGEAINNFNFLIDAYPNSLLIPRAKYAIADALYNQSKYEEAIQQYKEIIDSYPSSPLVADALRSIQFCYVALGREKEALQIADDYINRNPESPFAADFMLKKGEMLFVSRSYKDAIVEYDNFLKKFPQSEKKAEATYWMAKSYQSLGDNENASKIFEKIYEKFPDSEFAPLSLLELGLSYKNTTQIRKADSVLTLLQEKYPDDPSSAQAGFEQATIKFNLGDTTGAIAIWKRIAEKFADTEFADQSIYRIAMYFRVNGQFNEAIKEFSKIANTQNDPNLAAESQFRIGEIYTRLGNCADAINEYEKVKNNYAGIEDWYTLSLLNLADCYEKLGNIEEAMNSYRAVIASRTNDDFVATAKRRLSLLEQNLNNKREQ